MTDSTTNTTPVPPEHQESADYFEQLARDYEARGDWALAEIVRGAISKLGQVYQRRFGFCGDDSNRDDQS